ncbi:hypothetical protein N7528_003662 [Penicillium herquei]|nr:hypothetical protein N7528_003662 [Penicillium herquei]
MSDTTATHPSHPTPTRTHRSSVACQACRQRKVRCSLSMTGNPCIGCAQDQAECIVIPKQRKKAQRPPAQNVRRRNQTSVEAQDGSPGRNAITALPIERDPNLRPGFPAIQGGIDGAGAIPLEAASASEGSQHVEAVPRVHPQSGFAGSDRVETAAASLDQSHAFSGNSTVQPPNDGNYQNEEQTGMDLALAALGQSQNIGQVPFYRGDQTGPTYALDICFPEESLPSHMLTPSHSRPPFSEAEINYLQSKGALSLPGKESCDALLRAYFYNVHPIMPVIQVDHILDYQVNERLHEYNILLLWCTFFVAINASKISQFVSPDVYEREGYKSRKEMKAVLYSRAKCVYAISDGADKTILLQASLLLGFWISELDEHMEPWYWTGNAVNLCQMMGLHRNPDSPKTFSTVTDQRRFLWRRLWWSAFFRDRWLGLHYGQALRINFDDCDASMPLATDMLSDVIGLPESISASFIPPDLVKLATHWVTLIYLSRILGSVMTMNYQPKRNKPSIQQFEALEAEILQCNLPDQYASGLTRLARFQSFHVHLHYQALLITFYRPYGSEAPIGIEPANQWGWRHRMRLKTDDAASKTNDIVDALARDGLLEFAGPMTPSLIIPAMQTHLLFYKTADPLSKSLRLHRLEMCMLVLETLQKTYIVAAVYRGIFLKAIQHIRSSHQTVRPMDQAMNFNSTSASDTVGRNPSVHAGGDQTASEILYNPSSVTSSAQMMEDAGGILNSILDESTAFNLWETWNQM